MSKSVIGTIGKKQIDVANTLVEKLQMRWHSSKMQDGSVVVSEAELNNIIFLLKNFASFADLANKWTPKRIVLDKNADASNQVLSIWMEDSLGNTKTCSYAILDQMATEFCVDQQTLLQMLSSHFAEQLFVPVLKEALGDFNKSIIQNAVVVRSSQ
jgi:hypothetical protein